jgi:hypothetical protein
MNPQLTTYFMADQITRAGFNRRTVRHWNARQAGAGQNCHNVIGNIRAAIDRVAALKGNRPIGQPTTTTISAAIRNDMAESCA